jgi:hypothetical protein
MRAEKTRFFAIALTLGAAIPGLSACGSVHWYKAGADEAALTKDLGQCRGKAQARFGVAGSLGPPPAMDPRFGGPSGPSQADQMMQESQAVGVCMREKGYALVSDKK